MKGIGRNSVQPPFRFVFITKYRNGLCCSADFPSSVSAKVLCVRTQNFIISFDISAQLGNSTTKLERIVCFVRGLETCFHKLFYFFICTFVHTLTLLT